VRPGTLALGAAVIGTALGLLPFAMVRLNSALGWPRWESGAGRVAGAVLVAAGAALALYCSRLFARLGQGTPVPTQPPRKLVVAGAYRWSRNPIYVADVTMLTGIFLYRGELALLLYVAFFALASHLVIVWREEPELRARFGEAYDAYVRRVPRWLGLPRAGER
jgi:protein-S-isoprenylcysteine O-methyltransferase Ste14